MIPHIALRLPVPPVGSGVGCTRSGAVYDGRMSVGIDLLEIERMGAGGSSAGPSLALRLFTDGERAYAAQQGRPAQHLAARFCAKEAVAKALRLEVWSHHDIEVVGRGAQTGVALHWARSRSSACRSDILDPKISQGALGFTAQPTRE